MSLRFVILLITRLAAWLRLSRREEEAQKTTEILILRHQLAVLQRRQLRRTIQVMIARRSWCRCRASSAALDRVKSLTAWIEPR